MLNLLEEHPITHVTVTEDMRYSDVAIMSVAHILATRTEAEKLGETVVKIVADLEPWTPVTREGKMLKRITAYMFKAWGKSLHPNTEKVIGNYLGLDLPAKEFIFDVNKKFDWKGGDFGDKGSCFFGHYNVWNQLREANASALRFWTGKKDNYKGSARTLVVPNTDDVPVVINAYGATLSQFASRIQAIDNQIAPTPVFVAGSGDVTVNMETGLLIAGADTKVDKGKHYKLKLRQPEPGLMRAGARFRPNCSICGELIEDGFFGEMYRGGRVCRRCVAFHRLRLCEQSQMWCLPQDAKLTPVVGKVIEDWVRYEQDAVYIHVNEQRNLLRCHHCDKNIFPRHHIYATDGEREFVVCGHCMIAKGYTDYCHQCGCRKEPDKLCWCKAR